MAGLFVRGVMNGIKTTRFPRNREGGPGVSPGIPVPTHTGSAAEAVTLAAVCPTGALEARGELVGVDLARCIHCQRCASLIGPRMKWRGDYEWTRIVPQKAAFERPFRRSMNILVVDAGDCGACLNEVRQLNNPYYNMHRLGFFTTPTPRNADLLLVVGPVTEAMRHPLVAAWEAMPEPRKVAAVGACALCGSVFGPSFTCGAGVRDLLPVDAEVPGNPPPPLAILHALLILAGRAALGSDSDGETA